MNLLCFKLHLITWASENWSEVEIGSVQFTYFKDEDTAVCRGPGTCLNRATSPERFLGHSPSTLQVVYYPGRFSGHPKAQCVVSCPWLVLSPSEQRQFSLNQHATSHSIPCRGTYWENEIQVTLLVCFLLPFLIAHRKMLLILEVSRWEYL